MAEEGQADDTVSTKLHPFFTAPNTLSKSHIESIVMPITPESSCGSASDKLSDNIENDVSHTNKGGDDAVDPDIDGRRRKRRKTGSSTDCAQPATNSTRSKRARVSAGASILNHLAPKKGAAMGNSTVDGNSPGSTPTTNSVEILPSTPEQTVSAPIQTAGTDQLQPNNDSAEATIIPPKKLLILNPKTGTIGSPPKPKPTTVFESVPPKKRGRRPKRLLVSLQYGEDETSRIQIGQKINNILIGSYRMPAMRNSSKDSSEELEPQLQTPKKATPEKTPQKKGTPKKATPKKSTHPFFLGKNKPETETRDIEKKDDTKQAPRRQTIFTSTPCSPNRFNRPPKKFNLPQFGSKSGGLKTPGAQHPAWPWREISHVRGDDSIPRRNGDGHSSLPVSKRKAKRQEIQIGVQESVLHQAGVELNIAQLVEEMESLNTNDFQPPHPLLRVPRRHFESGKRLQARITPQLHSRIGIDTTSKVHPAISHAFESLGSTLSAFDRATCENSTWTQKYAPPCAANVLQNGREAELLRGWLETLKVQAVDTGSVEGTKSKSDAAPRRRGRKKQKLDGFVISSDEEEMDEISDDDDGWAPNISQTNSKKTVVKPISTGGSRLTNAVLLSGPHGCGKTATVFAIAKELDFEVFEISPGSRRNGKDILEKVGDMTRNHLVQHHQKEDEPAEDDIDDQVAQDLKSGKQGTMTSFFKPNSTAQAPKPKKQLKSNSIQPKASSNSSILPAKTQKQKQSLILLEEVDVLYDEDKQFWATIMSMISQSKRPFIMTCNDESLVPIQSLNLHGIFRFSSPAEELAVDLLLLIAANEGHALPRQAIEALYNSRQHDLRASISELNYWCQIGVGDPRGGFDWFYPRWPKGSDVDEEGNTIRVVSEGTYQTGMGWLGRDTVTTESPSHPIEEELQQQGWQNWSLDLSSSQESDDFSSWANASTCRDSSSHDRLALFKTADDYASRMSDADLCSYGYYAQLDGISLDTSLPALPGKVREDYTIGQQLVEVSPLVNYDSTSADVATTLKLSARSQLQQCRFRNPNEQTILKPLDEPRALRAIERSFKAKLELDPTIKRIDYSIAFDPLAVSEKAVVGNNLDPSVFDRTMKVVTLDVAPYVRSIVSYDQRLQKERLLRSNLISEGGKPGRKRMRNTRAALSALEGGSRASTRGERYFTADINPHLIMRTGGVGWDTLASQVVAEQSTITSSCASPGSGEGVDVDEGVDANSD